MGRQAATPVPGSSFVEKFGRLGVVDETREQLQRLATNASGIAHRTQPVALRAPQSAATRARAIYVLFMEHAHE